MRITVAITASTASPRGKRARRSSETNGFSSSAIRPATMNSSTIAPAARSTATTPSTASGSSTSCTQRGSTTGSTLGGRRRSRDRAARPSRQKVCAPGSIASARMAADTSILFVGDVVGRTGRRTLETLLPALREELAPTFVVVNGENAAGGHRDHAQGGRRVPRDRRRRDHARQPHLPPSRDLALPAGAARDRAPGQLPADPARPRHLRRRARRRPRSASSTSAATCSCRPAARRS